MCDRSQSDVVGVVLLISVVILTVTASGAVVLSEWESDVGDKPVADIESELTAINISVEHRGGQSLDPNQTRVEIIGSDETASLDKTLEPGGSTLWEFDRLDGSIELVLVDEPTETVLHRNAHTIVNPIEGLRFGVDGWTEPIYLLEGHPANYTVAQEFELGGESSVTEQANVTVKNAEVVIDEDESTLEGSTVGAEVDGTAEFDNFSADTEIVVLESDPSVEIQTESTTVTSSTAVEATGDLVDLGGLPEVDIYFEYGAANRTFVEDPADNDDKLIADGSFWEDPDGYAHDGDYVHDNVPFEPGETRTYYIDESGSGADLDGSLRTAEQTEPDGEVDNIDAVSDREDIYGSLSSEAIHELEVTYASDGSEFVFHVDGSEVETWGGLDEYDELYFSTYEWAGSSGIDSLRLIGVDPLSEDFERIAADDGVDTERTVTEEVDGFEPETIHQIRPVAEQQIGGKTVTDSGEFHQFSSEGPSVETVDTNTTGMTSITATGNLTDLGDLEAAELFFEYGPVNRTFAEDPEDNDDKLIADGAFWNDPDGYAHDGDYVHDNEPFEPGETRTYYIDEAGSGADLDGSLRTAEQTEPDGDVDNIGAVSDREDIYGSLSSEEVHKLDVEYDLEGSEFVFYVDNQEVETWGGLDEYDELYFSTYEWAGSNGIDSLRLVGVDRLPDEAEQTQAETNVTEEGEFSEKIDGFEPERTHDVTAFTDQEIGGVEITERGEPLEFSTGNGPTVETVSTDVIGLTRINATGDLVDLGDLENADLYFEYGPVNRTFVENSDNNDDKLIADGGFWEDPDGYAHDGDYVHDNEPFEPGETRTYYIDEAGSGADLDGSLRTAEQTEPNGSVDNIGAVSDREDIYGGLSSEEIHKLEVEYDIEGSEFVFYIDGDEVETWGGLDEYDELYFSIYEWAGSSGIDSLRLIGVDRLPDEAEQTQAGTNVTETGEFTKEIDGFEPERSYDVTAFTDQEVDGFAVIDWGEQLEFSTGNAPTVETVSTDASGITGTTATGNLTDLGDLENANLSFAYGPVNRTFVESSDNNDDKLIADGAFWEDPDGYAHDGDYVHDNEPFEPGETRTYYIDEAGSGADLDGSLRTAEQTEPNGSVDNIGAVSDREDIYGSLSSETVHTLEVEYDIEGSEFVFYVDGDEVETWGGLAEYDELYFSTYEWAGSSGIESLRLIGVDRLPDEAEQTQAGTNVTETGEFTEEIDGFEPERSYDVTAFTDQEVDGFAVTDWGEPLEFSTGNAPTVETVSTEVTGLTNSTATGNLTDLGDLEKADLYFEYGPVNRTFVEGPADNEDKLIADGDFWEDPDGYAHDGDYIHDNEPFEPGETRTYYIDEAGSGADLDGSLRTAEQTEPNGSVDNIGAVSDREDIYGSLASETVHTLDVEYDIEGSEFVFYIDGDEVETWGGLDEYNELYFSTYEWAGSSGIDSLRLISVDRLPDNVEQTQVETNATETGEFTEEIDGLEPERTYDVTAFTDQEVDGFAVTDWGEPLEFSSNEPTVETVSVDADGPSTITATGNLTDLGDLEKADLYFEYGPINRTFVEDSADNDDKLIADGAFWEDPDGYAHDGDYVHDNDPFEPGETRTYYIDEAGSGADLDGSLRVAEQTEPDGSVDNIGAVSDREDIYGSLASETVHKLDVEYDIEGSEFVFYIDGDEVETWGGLDEYDELYFSTYEWAGSSGIDSLRLIDVDRLPDEIEQTQAKAAVADEGEFTEEIDGLEPERTYDVTAFTDQEVDGFTITDRGETLEFSTDGPTVETVSADADGHNQIDAVGDLTDLGDLNSVDVYFDYSAVNRTFVEDAEDNDDKLIAHGEFRGDPAGYTHDRNYVHDNEPFEPGEVREYAFDEAGSTASLRGTLRTAEETEETTDADSIDERVS